MIGLSTSGSISLGCALVAGRKRVPNPAAGNTALQTFIRNSLSTMLGPETPNRPGGGKNRNPWMQLHRMYAAQTSYHRRCSIGEGLAWTIQSARVRPPGCRLASALAAAERAMNRRWTLGVH